MSTRRLTCFAAIGLAAAVTCAAAACGDGATEPEPPPQPNRPPVASGTIPGQTVPVGESVMVSVASAFGDPDGDALTYSAASSAPGVASVTVSGAEVTVTGVSAGTTSVTVTASDAGGLSARQTFEVTVPNRAPAATDSIPDQTVPAGDTVSLDLGEHFSDPDGDTLTYAAESSAADMATVAVSGANLTVTGVSGGTATITVTASDPEGFSAQQAFEATVPNRAPVATDSIPDQTVQAGDSDSVDLGEHFSDPDGDALTYRAESSAPAVASVAVSGASVTVTGVSAGTATVTVTARDPGGLEAKQSFQVTVPNRPPEPLGTIPTQSIATGETVSLDASAYFTDPDGDALTYTATSSNSRIARASVSGSTVTITGVAAGLATITVTAQDPGGLTATQRPPVTVIRQTGGAGFGPGEHRVNVGIRPGRYYAIPNGEFCTWERLDSAGEIIAIELVWGGHKQAIVDIDRSDHAFRTNDACGRWFSTPRYPLQASIPAGYWEVGTQLTPGTYRVSANEGCYWARLRRFSGEFRDIIDNDFVDEHEVGLKAVTIRASDGGFVTDDDCGTWTRVQGHMALEGQPSAKSSEEAIRRAYQQNQAQEKAGAGNRSGPLELEPGD